MFWIVTTLITVVISCLINSCGSTSWNEIDPLATEIKGKLTETFRCKNGLVIDSALTCNGVADCEDASDESRGLCLDFPYIFQKMLNWNENYSIGVRQKRQDNCDFRCGSGECVSTEKECDGKADCRDASDETAALCSKIQCPGFLARCRYGACIERRQVCDGVRDCADGSDEQGPGCKSTVSEGKCGNFEFRCDDGTCIDNLNACDGVKNCPDGSDETADACTGVVCQSFLYRCEYGACISLSARCNNVLDCVDGSDEAGCPGVTPVVTTPTPPPPVVTPSDGCLLPPHPPNGKYKLYSGGAYQANTYASPSTVILVECDPNYITESAFFFCNTNSWGPPLENNPCLRTCPPLEPTDTYDVECQLNFRETSCKKPVQGTIALLKCKPFYVYRNRQIPSCSDGSWDPYPAPCVPECGKKIVNAQTLVIGGGDAEKGEYPWVVAVYNTSLGQKKHICGGTVISRLYILSAAHCFTTSKGEQYDKSYFTVVAGKYYRDLDKVENGMQRRDIKRLYIHEDYRGQLQKHRDDIALVEVEKLEVTIQVQPVCLDWDNANEDRDFVENVKAVVAGWGFTAVGSNPAEVLKKLIVPFQPPEKCKKYMEADFYQQYYSSDKICAGYNGEGASVCSGDSGGGLYFREASSLSFYIRGIVSLAPRNPSGCDSNHYALYTKVSKYLQWIERVTLRRL